MARRKRIEGAGNGPVLIEIPSALSVQEAAEARAALLARLEALGANASATVELAAGRPTAPSLQLAAATRASLLARDGFSGFGPNAATIFRANVTETAAGGATRGGMT